jgi:hypothetical protein
MLSLETMGWLKAEPQENPARPPTAWTVNPLVRERFAQRAAAERRARKAARERIAATLAGARCLGCVEDIHREGEAGAA